MGTRAELHTLLLSLMAENSQNVYFQPPASIKMKYPCILYQRDDRVTEFADNKPYKHKKRYQVTIMDLDPDSIIPDKVAELPLCSYDRSYAAENLNHDVYNLFF